MFKLNKPARHGVSRVTTLRLSLLSLVCVFGASAAIPLLASETGDAATQTAILMVLSGLVSSAATWGVQLWREKKNRDDAAEKTIVEHLQSLVNRLEREKGEKAAEHAACLVHSAKLLARAVKGEIAVTALRAHVRQLETLLRLSKIPFTKYVEPSSAEADDESADAAEETRSETTRPESPDKGGGP